MQPRISFWSLALLRLETTVDRSAVKNCSPMRQGITIRVAVND